MPEINNSRNAAMKAQAERQAVNSVVQVCVCVCLRVYVCVVCVPPPPGGISFSQDFHHRFYTAAAKPSDACLFLISSQIFIAINRFHISTRTALRRTGTAYDAPVVGARVGVEKENWNA